MVDNTIAEHQIDSLQQILQESQRIVITCHTAPDGDAIGSSLGLMHLLEGMDKKVDVITPDQPMQSLWFMPGFEKIHPFTMYADYCLNVLKKADTVLCLDYNASYRVDKMQDALLRTTAHRVLIDHHEDPEDFCELCISYPDMSSTCELVVRLIYRMGLLPEISLESATCLYTGMHTDTGGFSYNANNPELYLILAELMEKGVNKNQIGIYLAETSESSLRINGYALSRKMQLFTESRAAMIALSDEELQEYGYCKGDTEGLVNMPLRIKSVIWSTFLREEKSKGYVKVSMRSQGDFAVNSICEKYFGGGGHKNAAGGEFRGNLEQCIALYNKVVDLYKE